MCHYPTRTVVCYVNIRYSICIRCSISGFTSNIFGVFSLSDLSRISFFSGYHICERKSDVENPGDEDCKPLLQTTDPNQMPLGTNKEGT